MAIINDPDQITAGTEVAFDVATQTITLAKSGNLSDDGITGQALYSYCKEEWKDDTLTQGLIKYPFPMLAITPEQFEFGSNGTTFSNWRLNSDASRKLMRFCGWRENNSAGNVGREYLGVVSLGNIDATDKNTGDRAYYYVDGVLATKVATRTEFTYAGPVNEAIQIFGNATNDPSTTTFDYRDVSEATGENLVLRLRIFGKTYDESTATAIGLSTLTYNAQRFPLAESADPVITDLGVSTGDIDGTAPFTDMGMGWYAVAQNRTGFTTGPSDFGVIIDGDISQVQQDGGGAATAEQIYAWVQRQLIKVDTDGSINTLAGATATNYYGVFVEEPLILASTGNDLFSQQITSEDAGGAGVYVDSFNTDDKNRVKFRDNANALVAFPFVATGSLVFNNNLQNDAAAKYWLYYRYTRQNAISDLSISGASSNTATINTAGAVDFTNANEVSGFGSGALSQNDYIALDGFANPENNGIWQITSIPTATSFDATKVDGATVVNETGPVSGTLQRSPINSPDAVLVQNFADTSIGNLTIGGASSIAFDYDYDQDQAGGRNTALDAEVVLKVIGTQTAQYAEANFSIARTTGQQFPVTAPLERNYLT